jgi:DNA-binding transcriptional LysR family regulator
MVQRAPSWDELRTFVEVSRDGSLSGAARRLGLTQPTVAATSMRWKRPWG